MCLCCDRVWMREAVGNLIKNALDHTRAGDTVTVEGSRFADFVRIRVVDTGTGIHPEDLPHLFKRFYRSRFAQDTPGIGLGLRWRNPLWRSTAAHWKWKVSWAGAPPSPSCCGTGPLRRSLQNCSLAVTGL